MSENTYFPLTAQEITEGSVVYMKLDPNGPYLEWVITELANADGLYTMYNPGMGSSFLDFQPLNKLKRRQTMVNNYTGETVYYGTDQTKNVVAQQLRF